MSESQNMREYTGRLPQSRDRRVHVRRIPESLTYVELGKGNGGIVDNIGENGLSMTAAEMLVAEFFPRIRFRLPKSERFIETSAQIVWLSPSRKGAGIEFVDLHEDARNQLRKWISSGGSPNEFPERRSQPRGNEKSFPAMPSPRNVSPLAGEPINNSGLRDSELEQLFPSEFAPAPSRESARDSALDSGAYVSPLRPSRDAVASPRDSALTAASLLASSVAASNSASLSAGAIPGESGDFTPPRTSQPAQVHESPPSLPSFTRHQTDDSILKLGGPTATEWIEPVPARRNGAVIAVIGILLAALVFTAGLTVGSGYLEKWLGHGDAVKQVANASSDNSSHRSTNSPVNTNNSSDNSTRASASAEATANANASRTSPEHVPPQAPAHSTPQRENSSEPIRTAPHSAELNPPSQTAEDTNTNVTPENAPQQTPGASHAQVQISAGETQAAPNAEENRMPRNARASHTAHASKPGSATARAPVDEPLGPVLVTPPGEGSSPFRLTLPEKAVSASYSLAISSQRSVLVQPEPGPASVHHAERLQVGGLIFHVMPQYPRGRDQIEIEGVVKLRATVGENGQITDVKRISGPMPLIPAAMSAIREWRYTPTLLNGRPIKTEEDVTIVFRAH